MISRIVAGFILTSRRDLRRAALEFLASQTRTR